MPCIEIEVIGNICCLIEEQKLRLQIGRGCLGCFFVLGFVAFVGCVWIRHATS